MPGPVWNEYMLGIDTGVHIDEPGYGQRTGTTAAQRRDDRPAELRHDRATITFYPSGRPPTI